MPERFRNLHPHPIHRFRHFLKWKFSPPEACDEDLPEELKNPDDLVPVVPDHEAIQDPDKSSIQVTWIGHASFLVQIAGRNLLFDPVLGEHCAPLPFPSLKRRNPAALGLKTLPRIDQLFLSHNHYDHLEKSTVKTLGANIPTHVPQGLAGWLGGLGVHECHEYGWWDGKSVKGLRISCVPSQHFSARGPHDRNRTLWCGWVIELEGTRFYFVGDTGYAPLFTDIRKRLGAMVVSIIPIGAYRPRWFMKPVHVDPREALQIRLDVESRFSIASHWGTFKLTDEPLEEPPILLRKAMLERKIDEERFRIPRVGETLKIPI